MEKVLNPNLKQEPVPSLQKKETEAEIPKLDEQNFKLEMQQFNIFDQPFFKSLDVISESMSLEEKPENSQNKHSSDFENLPRNGHNDSFKDFKSI